MFPFFEWGPFDHSERKALLFAAVFSCLFIALVAFARPEPPAEKIKTTHVEVPMPVTTNESELPPLPMESSLEQARAQRKQFEQFDFNNHSYGPYTFSDGKKIDLSLAKGVLELPNDSGWFELKDVHYTDLTGDGKAEAIVRLYHVSCGVSCDGGANMFYIYTVRNGKLKQIWQYETGSYADGCGLQSFTAGKDGLVLMLFGHCEKGIDDRGLQRFTSRDSTYILFEFDGRRFVPQPKQFFDTPVFDTKNYEPDIRIF